MLLIVGDDAPPNSKLNAWGRRLRWSRTGSLASLVGGTTCGASDAAPLLWYWMGAMTPSSLDVVFDEGDEVDMWASQGV